MAYDLKNEKDVQLFLKNLYTEYSFGCYSEKNPEVCHLFGEYHDAIKRDFTKAAEIYKNNCDNFNFGRSCSQYARYNTLGTGVKRNMSTAYEYMKKGCEFGDGIGCLYASLLIFSKDNIGVNKDEELKKEGFRMLNKSCLEKNEPNACSILGAMCYTGRTEGVEKNLPLAYKSFLKACESGIPAGCLTVARMLNFGEGIEQNEELSASFREKAADLENQMKGNQGLQWQQGI